jgi:hypothetical protein
VFIAAIELLEALEYHSKTFASSNWEWTFETVIPWLAIAIVLTELPQATQQSDIDRAQWQSDLNFQRFSDSSKPVSRTPMWKLLVQLRESMQGSPGSSPPSQGRVISTSNQPLQAASVMHFDADLILTSGLYPSGADSYLYEDQFMQDLPWWVSFFSRLPFLRADYEFRLNTQMPY